MVKISMYKEKGALLVIWRTPKEKLIGEFFSSGVEKRGKWDNRATFEDKDATEYRVLEYFGFDTTQPAYWRRWA